MVNLRDSLMWTLEVFLFQRHPCGLFYFSIKKVVVCSGKHYYALDSYRKANKIEDTAIIRLELLCPFPSGALYSELMKYSNAQSIVKEREREKLNERERGVKSEKE
jgi:2-oxoglutarate dehydrogenase complex dehydrogenase (E1) component-like enzyme